MDNIEDNTQREHALRYRLFDQDGLPWTSRLRWGMLFIWVAIIWFVFAPLVGIYLGVWLVAKRRSALSLVLYAILTVILLGAFLIPSPVQGAFSAMESGLNLTALVLWFAGAFALRREVIQYYSSREGVPFHLNPVLTAVFGPWYIGGHLRADFPLDNTGKVGAGVLKLIV
jgi:hypothetical protein